MCGALSTSVVPASPLQPQALLCSQAYAPGHGRVIVSIEIHKRNVLYRSLQAEVLLGSKADDLAQVREQEETRFAAVMRERVWQEYVLRVKAQAQ